MRLGPSGEPPGEEKAPTYHWSNSLWLIINLLSHKKGENYINVIKVNGIRIPFTRSLLVVVEATKMIFFFYFCLLII